MKKMQLRQMTWALGLMVLMSFIGTPSYGASFYLRADVFSIPAGTYSTIPQLPNENIMMWGYSSCDSTFTNCTGPTVPGPILTANEGEVVNITVQNNLTSANLLANAPAGTTVPFAEKDGTLPTSLIVPGQNLPLNPTWISPAGAITSTGSRAGGDFTSRVRSFTAETLPLPGPTNTYTFTNAKPGTYLYQSGTHPQIQVQMGLYGALIVRAGGDPPNQVTLLLSEIDQDLHYSVQVGLYGTPPPAPPGVAKRGQRTSTVDYHPDYFLINGNPFTFGLSPIPAGNANQTLLIRFLNAGLMEKTPTLHNRSMTIIAEDGNVLPHPKVQYSTLLPAGKTLDATINTGATGYIPVYDRALNLTNAALSPGGDLVYLQVGASQFTLTVTETPPPTGPFKGTITARSLPAGINCGPVGLGLGPVCSQAYIGGTEINLVATPVPGSLLISWAGGGCDTPAGAIPPPNCMVTMNADTNVTATFTEFTSIKVLAPKAGDVFHPGDNTTIWWGAPANAVKFTLRYKVGNKFTTIASNVTGNTYPWVVPVLPKTNASVVVQVIGYDAKGKKVGTGNSGKFTILVP
jgi:FtsP/CotA-like multicopper oxidase with cupredoxin domain